MAWPRQLLDALRAFDEREAPHGIYGVREAYGEGRGLPSLAYVLASPRAGVLSRMVGHCRTRRGSDEVTFLVDQVTVELTVIDYASTKIRRFGSAYRLDTHDGKTSPPPELRLERRVPDLRKSSSKTRGQGLLLVMHTESERQISDLVGRAAEPAFLERYSVDLDSDVWPDSYGRQFRTGLFLWSAGLRDI